MNGNQIDLLFTLIKVENEDYCEICFDCDTEDDILIFCDICDNCVHIKCAHLDENVIN